MVSETIQIGNLIVEKQIIGIANVVEVPAMDEVNWDGILGLAFANENLKSKSIDPIMDTIMKQHILENKNEKNQIGYNLEWSEGSITIGGPNPTIASDEDFFLDSDSQIRKLLDHNLDGHPEAKSIRKL